MCYNVLIVRRGEKITSTKIGARIRQLRLSVGMTQRDLAQRINVGNTTLSQYESGARVPSDEVKIKIASVFGVSVDYLLGASSERNSTEKVPCSPAVAQRPVEAAIAGARPALGVYSGVEGTAGRRRIAEHDHCGEERLRRELLRCGLIWFWK